MRLTPIVLLILIINSCVENNKTFEYDLSDVGAINSIKEINGTVYILNSTKSSILKISGGKIDIFRDIEIKGRDFLLDFDIVGDTVYYSNTYDEIFKASGNVIEDTIKIGSPDRIEVIGDRIFITSRKAEEGNFYLISVDKITGKIISKTALNDGTVTEGVFSTVAVSASGKEVWLINTFKSRLEFYGGDLKLNKYYNLDNSYLYGNFRVTGTEVNILCSKNGSIFICVYDLGSGDYKYSEKKCGSSSIDLTVSAVTGDGIYIYDYISGIVKMLR